MTLHRKHTQKSGGEYWALREIPTFPSIAIKLLQLLSDDNLNTSRLIDLLRSDASFSAELLRRANSSVFALRSQVLSLQHAIILLGFDRLRQLAMAVSLGSYLRKALQLAPLRRCWRHSLATALVADTLAPRIGIDRDEAYTAGLLHDIGLFGLIVNYPREYATMLEVTEENDFNLLAVEQALFEVDHCEAGKWLASNWNFPEQLVAVASRHHEEPGEEMSLTALIHWSGRIADALGFALIKECSYTDLLPALPQRIQAHLEPDGSTWAGELTHKINSLE